MARPAKCPTGYAKTAHEGELCNCVGRGIAPTSMRTVLERVEAGDFKNKIPYSKENRKAYQEEESRLMGEFRAALLEEHGVTNNPKASACYSLAWSHGHSSGLAEVSNYFSEFVELIK